MFNKRKANDPKYLAKKLMQDVRNIQYIGPVGADEVFDKRDYREWSLEFADKVYSSPEVIEIIDALPMATKKVIAWNLVTWHGDLITRFGEEIKNDPDVGRAAIGPDHILELPTKKVERVISRDGDVGMVDVYDFDRLKNWYNLFPELGEKAREGILRAEKLLGLQPREEIYLTENVPDAIKNDLETVKKIIKNVPFIYPALSEEIKKDPEVITKVLDTRYSKDAGEVLKTLSPEVKKEVLSLYRVGWYGHNIPEGLKFAFEDKEYMRALLENNKFDKRVLDAIDKELLKDPEFAAFCLSKLETGYMNDEKDFLNAFPKELFAKAENVVAFIKGMSYRYKDNETARDLVNGLSPEEFEKAARLHPYIVGIATTQDPQKVVGELVKSVEPDSAVQLMHAVGGFDKMSPEMQLEMFIKNPDVFYRFVEEKDREFFVEAALKNPRAIDVIKNPQLRSDVLVEYTTIKYLEKKAMKITTEEELDKLIEKVRGVKKSVTRTPKAKTQKETKSKSTKK